jgi:FHS family L-fucose permease-like MFS transporter
MSDEKAQSGSGWMALMPILFGFFVMGFVDVVGTATAYVKAECGLSDKVASFLPSMIFMWFFLISVPSGVLAGKIGRKNTVLVSLAITVVAMFLPLAAGPKAANLYFVAFALMGIGNTIIQAALPSLMSNVVAQDQLTSRLSLGQFVKALCAAVSPIIAGLAAKTMGNWKLIFPIYGAITVLSAVWLMLTPIKKEEASAQGATFGGCLALLGNPYILAMFTGILFSVGADVGFGYSIPPYMKDYCKMDANNAAMAPTVYFIAKTIGSFLGALIFAKFAPSKCFPYSVLISIVATVGMLFTKDATAVLACVFVASLGLSNTFGMAFGLAMNRLPQKANEISGLMVMAIAGGAIIPPIMGAVQSSRGIQGLIYVLIACLVYLFGLGLFAACQKKQA